MKNKSKPGNTPKQSPSGKKPVKAPLEPVLTNTQTLPEATKALDEPINPLTETDTKTNTETDLEDKENKEWCEALENQTVTKTESQTETKTENLRAYALLNLSHGVEGKSYQFKLGDEIPYDLLSTGLVEGEHYSLNFVI